MLLERATVEPLAAIERLAGMQAQLARPSFIGLWSRVEGFRREDLVALIDRRDVVRATMMRGTIHLMSRADYVKFRSTIQPALTKGLESVMGNRTSDFTIEEVVAAAREHFENAPCTFDDFRRHLLKANPKADERAIAYAVRLHLPIVQIPNGSKWAYPSAAQFALAESWLGEPVEKKAHLDALVVRYLAAFGPASPNDMKTWSAFGSLRETFDELRPKLVTFRDEHGKELFDLPKAPRPGADHEAPVRFLPDYDNLALAHDDRTRVIADEHRPLLFTKNLAIPATFLADGFVAGSWKIERKGKTATLQIFPFVTVPRKSKKELFEEGEKLVRFVEEDAKTFSVSWN